MTQPVFIIASQRSGSNYLRSLLVSTGMFKDFNEILDPYWEENYKNTFFYFRKNKIEQNADLSVPYPDKIEKLFMEYLAYIQDRSVDHDYSLLDVKYNSLHHFNEIWEGDWPFLFNLINKNKIKMIHLVRDNLYHIYQSLIIADHNQKYTIEKEENAVLNSLKIDCDDMILQIKLLEQKVEYISRICTMIPTAIEVKYEELTSNQDDSISNSIRSKFDSGLDIKLTDNTSSWLRKMVTKPDELIVNYDEVMNTLKMNGYQRFAE